jgi:7-cyano-7-deazaguanine synthase
MQPVFPDSMNKVAVLASGGIDSSVLLCELARLASEVVPIHISFGLCWDKDELAALQGFLAAVASPKVAPLKSFKLPLGDVYEEHWSVTGIAVPGATTSDDAVYLPGRNLFQLVQAGVWCLLNNVRHIGLATLAGNPFPDATPDFFAALEKVLSTAVGAELQIIRPYEGLNKTQVIQRGQNLPLERTMSCLQPVFGVHCGICNKCAERQRAFAGAQVPDRTEYLQTAPT